MDLATELAAHPAVVVALLTALVGGLAALIKVFLTLFERRVNEKFAQVEEHNSAQDERLEKIEVDLHRYETNVAVGAKETSAIHAVVEGIGLDLKSITKGIADLQLSNEIAHAGLINGQDKLTARVVAVESKLPNGELKRLADAFERLAERER